MDERQKQYKERRCYADSRFARVPDSCRCTIGEIISASERELRRVTAGLHQTLGLQNKEDIHRASRGGCCVIYRRIPGAFPASPEETRPQAGQEGPTRSPTATDRKTREEMRRRRRRRRERTGRRGVEKEEERRRRRRRERSRRARRGGCNSTIRIPSQLWQEKISAALAPGFCSMGPKFCAHWDKCSPSRSRG